MPMLVLLSRGKYCRLFCSSIFLQDERRDVCHRRVDPDPAVLTVWLTFFINVECSISPVRAIEPFRGMSTALHLGVQIKAFAASSALSSKSSGVLSDKVGLGPGHWPKTLLP
ncbi:hypothetical protein F441_04196 [Phytophthora nicotianae CJ01A1]|uniref:Uncharacterized protein n=5 Tax=Phytophthora nicotianae TaxID=4792 RepID=V9FPG8_PHYNI|nr:hypothetical protein F443_04249 [Phytophthora nicotianae P1569]ETK92587.1 hypothetical protein L915_04109 [Phytophthora nicotianae]ETL45996.1 hypothetical protein L916_04060 [Phytophthora nicotianae]ETP22552.1 hypothetical protein F441_04196 [Phytophthora nicotianae CJ01A1]ETP50514.1 hypothetical protein F442_04215 [Phytophthora nicotianae P10297]